MSTTTTKTRTAIKRRAFAAFAAAAALLGLTETASAQEILLTGPLAGAPAVREMRLYREGRFEIAPAVSFTLLDEYQRHILLGGRLNYNLTDWLAIGVWGAYGGLLQLPTDLSDEIQRVNDNRRDADPDSVTVDRKLTAVNLGPNFKKQIGGIEWIAAPQLTFVPFRGKLALFQSIYLDTDLYFFGGAAFINVSERRDCEVDCDLEFRTTERVAITGTGGLGFTFYVNKWNALGFEARVTPFAWNTGGFDTAGGGQDKEFPDNKINADDRQLHVNTMLTLSWNFYLPTEYRISE
jgi:outer membrane beta-barrel protein